MIMNWYLKVLKQYVDFSGRARRTEYWMFSLFVMIFAIAAEVLDYLLGTAITDGYGLILSLYCLAMVLPSLAVSVRRLHDLGKGGGWIYISLVPLIGSIWLLILLCTDSEPGDNRFGQRPK
jgi:uncharacterized membrane protein YhaH (DUF805 family)